VPMPAIQIESSGPDHSDVRFVSISGSGGPKCKPRKLPRIRTIQPRVMWVQWFT